MEDSRPAMMQVVSEVLEAGLDDWVPILEIDAFAFDHCDNDASRLELALSAVRYLTDRRLVDIGHVSDSGFEVLDKPESTLFETASSILRQAAAGTHDYTLWMQLTPSGRAHAEDTLPTSEA